MAQTASPSSAIAARDCKPSPRRRGIKALILGLGLFGIGLCPAMAEDTAGANPATSMSRGHYLATAADCSACHTAPGATKPFGGGYAISTPLGTIFSTNITPSKSFGIGDYSEADFARALRQGIAKDGSHLYPAMPYTSYAKLSDDDISALYDYFMHEVAPAEVAPQKTALPFPFSIRASMIAWNLLFLDSNALKPDPTKSSQWNRGAYISEALAHCSTCHTPRDIFMGEKSGAALSGGSIGSWYAPNITSDPISGIGGWSNDEVVQYLRTGHVAGKAQAAGPMGEAVDHSLQHLSSDDIEAVATYLKQTTPITSSDIKPRYAYGEASTSEVTLRGDKASTDRGWLIFSGSCAACHQDNGAGNGAYPSLFHNTATGASRPDNLVSTILYGLSRNVGGKPAFMPAFGPQASFTDSLSDQDIADVSNYVLTQYGNPAVKVSAADVATIRAGGPEPLLAKLGKIALPAIGIICLIILLLILWLVFRRPRPAVA